jgi:uncharacterized protein YndB with AHSA1/START domain
MTAMASNGTAVVTLPTDTQILITREFNAPKHLVYKAWTTPELVKRWWSADMGETTVAEIDLRVGGSWHYVMVTSDGFEVGFHGEYREVIPDERIVSTEVYEGMPEGSHSTPPRSPKWRGAPPSPSSCSTRAGNTGTLTSTPGWRPACRKRWTSSRRSRTRLAEQVAAPRNLG